MKLISISLTHTHILIIAHNSSSDRLITLIINAFKASSSMGWSTTILACLLFAAAAIATVNCNSEGDVLHAWKSKLADPYNVLTSWDPTLVNPCTWFHVTCNAENSVTRVDLGSAGLAGPLIPELQYLTNLQYFEVFDNSLNGPIPIEFGNLRGLISLDLYQNKLSGHIPSTLGNLMSLRFMRLHSNMLSGRIPTKVIQLILWGNLEIMDLSDNMLAGRIRSTNSTGFAITTVKQDPRAHK